MSKVEGYPAYPEFDHFLEPMWFIQDKSEHFCRLCCPEAFATLAPGYVTCARCGVVIATGKEDDPMNEALDVCYECATHIELELTRESN